MYHVCYVLITFHLRRQTVRSNRNCLCLSLHQRVPLLSNIGCYETNLYGNRCLKNRKYLSIPISRVTLENYD